MSILTYDEGGKKMKANITTTVLTITALFFLSSRTFSDGTWTNYTNGNNIIDMAVGDNYFWCATYGGVVRWNITEGTYVKYTSSDGLASDLVQSVAIGQDGVLWCGIFGGGVSRFDGSTWTTYPIRRMMGWYLMLSFQWR